MQRTRPVIVIWVMVIALTWAGKPAMTEDISNMSFEGLAEKEVERLEPQEEISMPSGTDWLSLEAVNPPLLAVADSALPLEPETPTLASDSSSSEGNEEGLEIASADGDKKPGKKKEDKGKEKKAPKKVEVTGTYRLRYESKQNFDLIYDRGSVQPGQHDDDDNYLLHQLRLFLDLRPNEFVQAHFTFQDAREFGSHLIDHSALDREERDGFQNKIDLYEAYVKLKLGPCPAWIQVGRQEMNYGDGRLIGSNRWRNTGKSYDAVRLILGEGDATLDLFAANVVMVDSNAWDKANKADDILGAYATVKNQPYGTQDLYLIYRNSDLLHREIYTLGTLLKGDEGPLDWRFEGAYQWGSALDLVAPARTGEDLDHEAWAASAEVGYTWKDHPLKPRFGLEYDFATGDRNPNDGEDNTFDNLFPRAHSIHGWMDFFAWKNMHDPHVKLSWQQSKKLKISTEWHLFFLDEEETDAWYSSSQRVFRNAQGKSVSNFAGHEFDLKATYKAGEKTDLELGYGHFFAGDYAADTAPVGGGADDADFVYVQTTWKF